MTGCGVANFSAGLLKEVIEHSKTIPAVSQIEFHPLCQQEELRAFMRENNIQLEAWSPLGSGNKDILTDSDLLAMAEKHQKNIGQIILCRHFQKGGCCHPKIRP